MPVPDDVVVRMKECVYCWMKELLWHGGRQDKNWRQSV